MTKRRETLYRALALATIIVALAVVTSPYKENLPEPESKSDPPIQEIYSARKYYEINGNNGDSPTFLEQYAQYAPFIRGEVETIEECEQ